MIDQMDSNIKTWIESLPLQCEVTFQPPTDSAPADNTVLAQLFEATPMLPTHDPRRLVLQIALRYLIVVYHSDVTAGHRLLADLIFDMMQNSLFEIDTDPLPLQLWSLLGIRPQPAFCIRVIARRESALPSAQPVQELNASVATTRELHGIVMDEKNRPIMNALISHPNLGLTTRTTSDGRFQLRLVDEKRINFELVINVRGTEQRVKVGAATTYQKPLVVHVDPTPPPSP